MHLPLIFLTCVALASAAPMGAGPMDSATRTSHQNPGRQKLSGGVAFFNADGARDQDQDLDLDRRDDGSLIDLGLDLGDVGVSVPLLSGLLSNNHIGSDNSVGQATVDTSIPVLSGDSLDASVPVVSDDTLDANVPVVSDDLNDDSLLSDDTLDVPSPMRTRDESRD